MRAVHSMNDENLVSLATRQQRERIAIARKGGQTRSVGKKMAARLRSLKKKGLTNDDAKHIADMLTDPEYFAGDVLKWLHDIKDDCSSSGEKVALANSLIKLQRVHYGDKLKTENTHVHINWNDMMKSCEKTHDAEIRAKKSSE